MSIYATRLDIPDDEDTGTVIAYRGSHLQPNPADRPANTSVDTAHIPGFCVTGHPDQHDPWPVGEWLRLAVDGHGGHATVLIDETAARSLAADLVAWADTPKVAPQ